MLPPLKLTLQICDQTVAALVSQETSQPCRQSLLFASSSSEASQSLVQL